MKKILVVLLCFLVHVFSAIDGEKNHIENLVQPMEYSKMEETIVEKFHVKCKEGDINACLMLKAVHYFNLLLKKSQIDFGDFEITKTKTVVVSPNEFSRNLNGEDTPEDDQLTRLFFDKVSKFIQTRSFKWKVTEEAEVVITGNDDKDGAFKIGLSLKPTKPAEGDARKKKDNGIGVLIAAAALKIGLLKALAFKALALLVGKALLVSKLALVLAVILGLKKLFSQEKHVTYEVVAHPHHELHHEHSYSSGGGHDSYGGWSRNFEGNKLAYRAHAP